MSNRMQEHAQPAKVLHIEAATPAALQAAWRQCGRSRNAHVAQCRAGALTPRTTGRPAICRPRLRRKQAMYTHCPSACPATAQSVATRGPRSATPAIHVTVLPPISNR